MKKLGSLFYRPKRDTSEIKRKKWNVWTILGKALKKTCMALGALVLFSVLLSTCALTVGSNKVPLPDDMVLVFNVENGIAELPTKPSLLDPFPFLQPTLRNVIDTLDKAKEDERVRGVVFNLKSGGINIAHTQELRTAISRFKESGKFTKIYASSYMDGGGGLGLYYLAGVFDEIWMQPIGMLSISGPSMEMPFAKDALDKLGVSAQFFQREEYKSAMENFTNSNMSESNQEALSSLLGNLTTRMISQISNDRKLNIVEVAMQVDKGLLNGDEALKARLIDRLDYGDVMVSEIRKEATGDPDDESVELITLAHYSQYKKKIAPKRIKANSNVALIYAVGTIVDSAGAQGNAGADEIAGAITEAYLEDDIEAIVLRVDSPGGSPSASETIRRALIKAQEKGKKVIISMGPVAASGGYWISTHADSIYASPGTITGSIGVVMGKFEAGQLFEQIGVNWEGPQTGQNADIWALHKTFDEQGRERINALIDSTYDQFLTRVAEGRKMSKEQARAVAKGRPWTGEQAKLNGLVDELGGLHVALDGTAKMLGKESREDLNVIRMPRELGPFEQVMQLLGQEVSLGHFIDTKLPFLKSFKGYFEASKIYGNGPAQGVYEPELEAFR